MLIIINSPCDFKRGERYDEYRRKNGTNRK